MQPVYILGYWTAHRTRSWQSNGRISRVLVLYFFNVLQTAFLHKRAQVVSSADMMTSSMFSASSSCTFIVKPVSAQTKITRNCSSSPLRISDGPRVKVKVRVEDVPVVISEEQCCAFVKLSSTVAMRTLSQRYIRWRPTSSVNERYVSITESVTIAALSFCFSV